MDVLLITGMWLTGSAWDKVTPELERLGHRPVALTLPGQGAAPADATLDDQVKAVLDAVDAAAGPVVVVGHSAASSLAWIAADARPDKVARTVLVGGFPTPDGQRYFGYVEPVDGLIHFPGWEEFAGPDSDDMDDATLQAAADQMVPVPISVVHGLVSLRDPRRFDVPCTLVCPEFSVEQAKEWVATDEATTELQRSNALEYVDIDSGHWPMFSKPVEFAALLDQVIRS